MKAILQIILFSIYSLFCYGQPRSLRFDNYTNRDGLSENNVYAICKDSRGFVWFGTDEGLNRFDGNSFTVYKHNDIGERWLPGNRIRSIAEMSGGKLLIGFEYDGLCVLDVHTEEVQRLELTREVGRTIRSFNVYDIERHSDSLFYVATDFGVQLYSPHKGFCGHYNKGMSAEGGLSSNNVRSIHISSAGFVWVGHKNGFTDKIDPVNKKSYSYRTGTSANLSLAEDSYGNIWVGSEGSGLSRISPNGSMHTYMPDSTVVGTVSDSVIRSHCIVSDNLGRIWIGTNKNGINELSQQNGDESTYFFIKHRTDKSSKLSIAGNSILSLYFDGEGILWVGHQGGGVSKVSLYPKRFVNIALSDLNAKSKNVQAVCPLPNGQIWVGTQTNGVFSFDNTANKLQSNFSGNSDYSLPNYDITSLAVDSAGNRWVGTNGHGLIYIDAATLEPTSLQSVNSTLGIFSYSHVVSVSIDAQQNVWVATPTKLFVRDASTKLFAEVPVAGLKSDNILKLCMDNQQYIWICTKESGAFYFKPQKYIENIEFVQIPPATESEAGVSHRTIYDIAQGTDGRIWLATGGGGVTIWDRVKGTSTVIGERQGLPTGIIRSIVADKTGKMWLSTHCGIVSIADGRLQIFNQEDGLLSDNFIAGASATDVHGRIYFGADIGLVSFRPEQIMLSYDVPKVILTTLRIFNTPVSLLTDASHKDLQGPLNSKDQIILNYRDYVFSIEFSAIDLNTPGKCKYQYRLVGFDDQWISTDANNRIATYTNLRDGEYVFMVKAANGDGVWSKTPTYISIKITPPFWETLWFRILLVCVIFAIATFLINRYRSKTEFQQKELGSLIASRTRELECQKQELERTAAELRIANATKDRFFAIIAHDLKSPFNAFIGFTGMLKTNFTEFSDEKKMQILDIVSQSALSMNDLLSNLLHWARTQSNAVESQPELLDIRSEIDSVFHLLNSFAESKKIKLCNSIDKTVIVCIDRNQLSAILRNLVSNSIKFTNIDGEVRISAYDSDESIVITISDNGVGMSTEQMNNLFKIDQCQTTYGTNKERGTGLGLVVVKEFVELNNGTMRIHSEKEVGTSVVLEFPRIAQD